MVGHERTLALSRAAIVAAAQWIDCLYSLCIDIPNPSGAGANLGVG